MVTRTGYKLKISIVSPLIVAELKKKHGVLDVRPFTYIHTVPESGAEIEFPYTLPEERNPPEEPPKEGEDGWERYNQCKAYWMGIAERQAAYRIERNDLVLASAVTIVGHRSSNLDWRGKLKNDKWRTDLQAGGLEIKPEKEYVLFLKAVVLKYQADYLKVLDLAIPQEVTMADVTAAWDRFQYLIRWVAVSRGDQDFTGGEYRDLLALLGDTDGAESEPDSRE